jgi:uncharacterized protein YdbL (DUF1318 family)
MNRITKLSALAALWCLASCVSLTVNINFPAAEIKQAAENIEDAVRSGEGAEGLSFAGEFRTAQPTYTVAFSLDGKSAYAADVDISVQSPEIKAIVDTRAKRYKKELEPELDSGAIGEGMEGFVVIRDPKAHDLKVLAGLKKLVKEENDDRLKMYTAILQANSLDADKESLEKVQKLFFDAIIKKMKAGHWYQKDKDTWEQKKKEEK